jgi:geranylgeranyl pyrophosphate synthase
MVEEELKAHKEKFISRLENFFSQIRSQNSGESSLLESMKYSLINSKAKYIRSFIILEVGKMLQAQPKEKEDLLKIAMAIEMVHAYSLIHDDLPSMDNSDFRRDIPSNHKKFGESTALLAGNSLLTWAFEILSNVKSENALSIIKEVALVSGFTGIMSGQVMDLSNSLKAEEFLIMNYNKTGKLLELCVFIPALLMKLNSESILNLKTYGRKLGEGYQMKDDILDEGEAKYSYVNYFGNKAILEKELAKTAEEGKRALESFPFNQNLVSLIDFLIHRKT